MQRSGFFQGTLGVFAYGYDAGRIHDTWVFSEDSLRDADGNEIAYVLPARWAEVLLSAHHLRSLIADDESFPEQADIDVITKCENEKR